MLHATTISFTSCVSRYGADLAREAAHLVERPRPVRQPRMVAEIDEVLVRQGDEALVQDGQPADAGVEHADRPRIHGGDRRTGLPCRRVVGRRSVLFAVVVAALVWSGSALAATPQQLTIAASDGAKLACSLVVPDGAGAGRRLAGA